MSRHEDVGVQEDPRHLLQRIQVAPHVLLYVDEQLLHARSFAGQALLAHPSAFEYLTHWQQDIALMELMVQRYPENFAALPKAVRSNALLARTAVHADPNNCAFLDPQDAQYEALVFAALHADPSCYRHVPEPYRSNVPFALRALHAQPLVYEHLPDQVQRERCVAQCALNVEPSNVWLLMERFGADRALMLQGFEGFAKPALLAKMDPTLTSDPSFVLACARIQIQCIPKAHPSLRAQLDQLLESKQAQTPLEALQVLCAQREGAHLQAQVPPAAERKHGRGAKAL